MKKIKFSLVLSIVIGILLIVFSNQCYATTSNLIPSPTENVRRYLKRYSSLVSVSSGYMRVYCNTKTKKVGIEYYDNNFNITSKKTIDMELELWGGFYAGKDAYYIVEGQGNSEQDYKKEVIRVIKYDTNWERIGHSSITSNIDVSSIGYAYAEVRTPFKSGGVEMTEINGKLYIATTQEGEYDSSVGQGHQGYLLIEVDETSLKGKIINADLNHSFTQYIDSKDNSLYFLEKNEGDYCTSLKKFDINSNFSEFTQSNILDYPGRRTSAWASIIYASVDGIALSKNNVLSIGTSIDQEKYNSVSNSTAYNIYLGITPKNNVSENSSKLVWLTNYSDKENAGPCFSGLEIVKISDTKFMVCWQEYEEYSKMVDNDILSKYIVHYVFIDENGTKLGQEYKVNASMSDCKPIVKNNKVVFYSANGNMVDFYTIDVNTGDFNKKVYYVMGDNASWSLDNEGVLTISGEGSLLENPENENLLKNPLSSTNGDRNVSEYDCWKDIKSLANKIIINEGITSIPEKKFMEFQNITEVDMPKSMETIGMGAFAYCSKLRTVYLFDKVKDIGVDSFWSGSFIKKDGKFVKIFNVTIYTNKGSYAEQWAKDNDIRYKYIDNETTDTGNSESTDKKIGWYQENGKWYYFNDNGTIVKNDWVLDKEKWYYLDENGIMILNCWKYIKNEWYCFNDSGVMLSNCWKLDKGKWYYLNKNGAMITNDWILDKEKWYYLDENGVMISNCWKLIKNKWYYFQDSGAIITNNWLRDYKGVDYYFNSSGEMISELKSR